MTKRATYRDAKVFIFATPQPLPLNQAAIVALTPYIEVKATRLVGEWGPEDNSMTYTTTNDPVQQKQKNVTNGGDPEIEFAQDLTDAGQNAIRAAAKTDNHYAMYLLLASGTKYYNRGLVMRKPRAGGTNDDFVTESYILGHVQEEIVV
jgi:hypothetical protein